MNISRHPLLDTKLIQNIYSAGAASFQCQQHNEHARQINVTEATKTTKNYKLGYEHCNTGVFYSLKEQVETK